MSASKKTPCPPAKPPLRGSQRKRKTRRAAVQGWYGRWAGVPGLCVSQLGLEQPQEPPAWSFVRAFHFLFHLRSRVLSHFMKLPASSAGAGAEASCLPARAGRFPPSADGGYSRCGVPVPRGSAWLALPGVLRSQQLSLRRGWQVG